MKKFSKKSIFWTIAVVLIVIAAMLYINAPAYLYNKAIEQIRKDAGLTMKSVNIPDFKVVYLEGGAGDTIIMIHGFGGNKDNWLRFAKGAGCQIQHHVAGGEAKPAGKRTGAGKISSYRKFHGRQYFRYLCRDLPRHG